MLLSSRCIVLRPLEVLNRRRSKRKAIVHAISHSLPATGRLDDDESSDRSTQLRAFAIYLVSSTQIEINLSQNAVSEWNWHPVARWNVVPFRVSARLLHIFHYPACSPENVRLLYLHPAKPSLRYTDISTLAKFNRLRRHRSFLVRIAPPFVREPIKTGSIINPATSFKQTLQEYFIYWKSCDEALFKPLPARALSCITFHARSPTIIVNK